jgi:hypothetical protein
VKDLDDDILTSSSIPETELTEITERFREDPTADPRDRKFKAIKDQVDGIALHELKPRWIGDYRDRGLQGPYHHSQRYPYVSDDDKRIERQSTRTVFPFHPGQSDMPFAAGPELMLGGRWLTGLIRVFRPEPILRVSTNTPENSYRVHIGMSPLVLLPREQYQTRDEFINQADKADMGLLRLQAAIKLQRAAFRPYVVMNYDIDNALKKLGARLFRAALLQFQRDAGVGDDLLTEEQSKVWEFVRSSAGWDWPPDPGIVEEIFQ